jgi:Ni/Co efflux regulator RcnB
MHMNKSLIAAATALLLLGTAGAASANSRHDNGHKGTSAGKGHADERSHHDRDCDGIANRFDHHDGRTHDARRSFAAPRYVQPRDYRYARYDYNTRLPKGYWGDSYYVDYQSYGLSSPPAGYRWNRVGNDVYLVSVRDGLIAQAVYSLFR